MYSLKRRLLMTKGDKYLIVFVIFISLASIFLLKNEVFNYDEKYVSIQSNGEEIKKIIFDKSIEGKKIPIETKYGYNLLELESNRVRVIEADCPDELDVKKGWIENVGESIVCLPNKLVIEIKGSREATEVDYISR